MVIDEAGNVWYDCPGFEDTRSETVEITTTFLIKSVIENASNVKVVLVVNYGSVAEGYDRIDFDHLLTHVTQLIKNIERYKNSVSLVLTKKIAQRIREGKIFDVDGDSVKRAAAEFMKKHRTTLHQKKSIEGKIQVIDALFQTAPEESNSKKSILWRPYQSGAFNTIPKMRDGRAKMRKSILEDTSYTEIQPNDFGFPMTHAAQIHIGVMERHTIHSISEILKTIDNHLLSALKQKIESIDGVRDRWELLEMCKRTVELNVKTLKDLTGRFAALMKSLNAISLNSNSLLLRIEQQINNLNILKTLTQTEINFPIRDLIANASATMDHVTAENRWYSFLVHVFEYYATYDHQRNVAIIDVSDLSDWERLNKPKGLTIGANNLIEFSKRFSSRIEVPPTSLQLKQLNGAIDFTNTPPQYECNGETMTIRGNFVKSLDIQPSECPSNRISRITVFA